jgi:hypothetical protein
MEYTYGLTWLSLWPIIIYLGYKFSIRNVMKFEENEG